ncbi:MAG TPA: hypothetical protein PLO16_07800 [Acidocella sp.]|nr:hypothetical protein [Acidocella sp.]
MDEAFEAAKRSPVSFLCTRILLLMVVVACCKAAKNQPQIDF